MAFSKFLEIGKIFIESLDLKKKKYLNVFALKKKVKIKVNEPLGLLI